MTGPGAKVLIVGPSWVGDMLMSHSLIQILQQTLDAPCIDVLAPQWSGALVQRMPGVRRHIDLPLSHGELGLRKRRSIGRQLRDTHYTQAIVLPNSFKSALVPWFANIPLRTGWRGEMRFGVINDMRVLNASELPQMTQRFCALGVPDGACLPAEIPLPRLRVESEKAVACVEKFGMDEELPILALCPGAEFGQAKRWPAQHFVAVSRDYLARGWQVLLFGSGNDARVCDEISRGSGAQSHCHNLSGRTSLAEAVDLMSMASAVVSNDSGLMHIAAALQLPLLALYGPTSPQFTPPQSDKAIVLSSAIDCAPCFARECPLGHHRCLEEMTPQSVLENLASLHSNADLPP